MIKVHLDHQTKELPNLDEQPISMSLCLMVLGASALEDSKTFLAFFWH
jgi:hypothetical protein